MLNQRLVHKVLIGSILSICIICANGSSNAQPKAYQSLPPEIRLIMNSQVNIPPVQPHLMFHDKEQAHAWLHDMSHRLSRFVPDPELRLEYLTIIDYEATRAKLDPQLILSIITVESRFKQYAISPVGARGLMQIMPDWQQLIGRKDQDLFDADTNIRYGCTILKYYLETEHGDLIRALERYNGSNGETWYPQAIYHAYTTYWHPYPVMEIRNGKLVAINYTTS